MSSPVPPTPDSGELLSYVNAQPVARGHGLRMVDNLGFLLAKAGCHPIIDTYLNTTGGTSPSVVPVVYTRNPGARVLMIALAIKGSVWASAATATVTASSGTVTWIAGAQNGIDGTTVLQASDDSMSVLPLHIGFLDVSALTAGTRIELRFTFTNISNTAGFARVHVHEVSLPASDPRGSPADEIGLDAAWPDVSGSIVQGSATGSEGRGIIRYVAELDRARQVKRHIQVAAHDVAALAWTQDSGAPGTFIVRARVLVRPRAIYGASVNNAYTFVCTYRWSAGATTGEAKATDSAANTVTVTLAAGTTRTTVTGSISLDTSGTDGLTEVEFAVRRTAGAGDLYVSNFALIEAET